MSPPIGAYFLSAFPFVTRSVLCLLWHEQMFTPLPEEAQERDVQRTFIFSLAGFSFTAVAGLAALDATARIALQLPTWYVLISFVAFVSSLNVQSYKSNRWQNQLATTLLEVGTLSLMLSLVALLFTAPFDTEFQWVGAVSTLGAWCADHVVRLVLDNKYLAARNLSSLKD